MSQRINASLIYYSITYCHMPLLSISVHSYQQHIKGSVSPTNLTKRMDLGSYTFTIPTNNLHLFYFECGCESFHMFKGHRNFVKPHRSI